MPSILQRAPRNLGTLTSADLNRSPTGYALDQKPMPTGAPLTGAGYSAVPGQPIARTGLRPSPPPVAQPDFSAVAPGSFGEQNVANNAGMYAPGSFGAQNAQANGTGYRAPQQTERANPLSGDNNVPMESTTTRVSPPPFVQRGSRLPAGQDAVPVKTTESIDSDIGQSMQGTFSRIAGSPQASVGGSGLYRRSFSNPQSANRYNEFTQRLFGAQS